MKMIMVPEERYNCMLESYNGAMEEILELSEEKQKIKGVRGSASCGDG